MDKSFIKELEINDEALKSLENDIYDISTKVGIKIKMKANRMIEKIYIPNSMLKDKELDKKLVLAFNEASELVSTQVSEDIIKLLLKKGMFQIIKGNQKSYE